MVRGASIPRRIARRPDVPTRNEFRCGALAVLLSAFVLYVDLALPRGVAGGVPYVAVVAVCLLFRAPRVVVTFGALGIALTVVGGLLSPPGGAPTLMVLNRVLAIVSILALTIAGQRLLARHAELELGLRELVATDVLTGAASRRHLMLELERRGAEAKRHGVSLSILMLDVDHFKDVNDRHGHQVGDRVLATLSARCSEHLRASDLLGRYGGEEFVVVCPNTGRTGAERLATRLRDAVREAPLTDAVSVTVSIGVATWGRSGTSADALLHAADTALYRAKSTGRDRVVLADPPRESPSVATVR